MPQPLPITLRIPVLVLVVPSLRCVVAPGWPGPFREAQRRAITRPAGKGSGTTGPRRR